MQSMSRRQFLTTTGAACLALPGLPAVFAGKTAPPTLTLGFSLYGMPKMQTEQALQTVADIGYDSTELCLMDAWDATPLKLNPQRRKVIAGKLDDTGLKLASLMEHCDLTGSPASQKPVLERLKRAAQLGHDLKPDQPPLIETTAGSGKWEDRKEEMRDNLKGWAQVAESTQTVIAVKPHRGGVVDRPEQGVWLVEQINSPWIRLNYDFSHFTHRDISLEDSLKTMLPYTSFIQIKDTVLKDNKARFVLPGESGDIDYVRLLKLAVAGGYRGDICCEVSGMVFKQPGYDPVAAAKTCYQNIAPAFTKAGIQRG
ncbi:sugar phosphate isomerase/epimerase family protein [Gimesia chilikensis]|uniref:sugar phosphate isomerase/epimerase family protein n=1 Tax=Gimesia chilikensis TaxID=2605989 RepID=UPI00118C7302|nr:sugar phosphate isomerase/epimerase family protein [Gimesia chilikensis]QDT83797.1 Xylose isomerase-like TIM barrel [Gimesia chilikensis]